jgi:hypothetical protein
MLTVHRQPAASPATPQRSVAGSAPVKFTDPRGLVRERGSSTLDVGKAVAQTGERQQTPNRAVAFDDREREPVRARLGVEAQQQVQAGGVNEREPAQVEHQGHGLAAVPLDRGLELAYGREVKLTVAVTRTRSRSTSTTTRKIGAAVDCVASIELAGSNTQ